MALPQFRLIPCAVMLFALIVTSFSHAQVYRCAVDGKTIYSDVPCATDAAVIDARPAAGEYDPAAARTVRNRASNAAVQSFIASRKHHAGGVSVGEIGTTAEQSRRCAEIARNRAKAEYWAGAFHHPENVRRERSKAEHWKERDFFECSRL